MLPSAAVRWSMSAEHGTASCSCCAQTGHGLAREPGSSSGLTCRRRPQLGQSAGAGARHHPCPAGSPGQAQGIGQHRASASTGHPQAQGSGWQRIIGGEEKAKRSGRSRRLTAGPAASALSPSTARGSRQAVLLLPANRHDSKLQGPWIEAASPVQPCIGRPGTRPDKLHADKGQGVAHCRPGGHIGAGSCPGPPGAGSGAARSSAATVASSGGPGPGPAATGGAPSAAGAVSTSFPASICPLPA